VEETASRVTVQMDVRMVVTVVLAARLETLLKRIMNQITILVNTIIIQPLPCMGDGWMKSWQTMADECLRVCTMHCRLGVRIVLL